MTIFRILRAPQVWSYPGKRAGRVLANCAADIEKLAWQTLDILHANWANRTLFFQPG